MNKNPDKVDKKTMKNGHDDVLCELCGGKIQTLWDSKYNGYRSTCNSCGHNWSES